MMRILETMSRRALTAAAASVLLSAPARAQSIESAVSGGGEGSVSFSFAARPGVCGDGETYLEDGWGGSQRIMENGSTHGRSRYDSWPACVPGPVRVVAEVSDGRVVWLRTYVGPRSRRRSPNERDLGSVSVREATRFLTALAERGDGRAASETVLPYVLADSTDPWPTLLRFSRDDRLSRALHRNAAFWLSRGAAAKLGIADLDESADDEVRSSAVFALSQQRDHAVPQLIEIARTNRRPAVRAQALFWLGQSGDSRAVDLFAEILERR